MNRREYTPDMKLEHNLIARAIWLGHCLPDFDLNLMGLPNPEQPADHSSVQMIDAFMESHRLLKEMSFLVWRGQFDDAKALAVQAVHAERRFVRCRKEYDQNRKVATGRYQPGVHFMTLDGIRFYFELIVLHTNTPERPLEIVNGEALDILSGRPHNPAAWQDLAAWLSSKATLNGRPIEDDMHLVWREDRGALVLRDAIRKKHPRMLQALEALRLSLTMHWDTPGELMAERNFKAREARSFVRDVLGDQDPDGNSPDQAVHAGGVSVLVHKDGTLEQATLVEHFNQKSEQQFLRDSAALLEQEENPD
ncbi:hypothetical protein [Deinococcus misasensis]|uniref:hypothetical protein n=1 Tax=Deinococcus misasensis TaxID=392413 RepID=UPI0005527DA8|nr:hypothetical protein [Deinococcus misasensis]